MKTTLRILALCAALAAGSAHASVTLTAAPQRVEAGEPVTVTVTVTGTGGRSSPEVPGREALGEASFTEVELDSSTGAQGVRTVRQVFSWTVRPSKPGSYALGPVTVDGETSSGVTVTVDPARIPAVPAPAVAKPGDERVAADELELSGPKTPAPDGTFARWAQDARKNPLPWIAATCALAMAWLAARTYSFLKKIETLAGPETPAPETPQTPTAEHVATLGDGPSFADQAVALVRTRIALAAGKDVSHLAASELADQEPRDAKRELVREALRLADAVRFGRQVGIEDEVRKLLKEYLA